MAGASKTLSGRMSPVEGQRADSNRTGGDRKQNLSPLRRRLGGSRGTYHLARVCGNVMPQVELQDFLPQI